MSCYVIECIISAYKKSTIDLLSIFYVLSRNEKSKDKRIHKLVQTTHIIITEQKIHIK